MCTTLVTVGMAWQRVGVDPCVHGVLVAWAMLELQEVVVGGCGAGRRVTVRLYVEWCS